MGDSQITHRGTHVQMIQHPQYGMTCYMDGCIQSSEADEKAYHQGLVGFALLSVPHATTALILGGGEGATAREVLRSRKITRVDMVDWDKDVVELFRTRYPQWGDGAWSDPRLVLHTEDAFSYVKTLPDHSYDVIVVDLFDPESSDVDRWAGLVREAERLLRPRGSLVLYTGMYPTDGIRPFYAQLSAATSDCFPNYERIPYRVTIPSFEGDCTFLLFR